ncbi:MULTISPECIES: DUF3750 domain-containing protein [Dickeya]|uniref:DUF3750 domain-containing protein n=1 Tax=Dickeya aquatica TaxID=1401087 RepID=A0A375A7P6_9GAMM|nr:MULTISPECIES: DUF3750 domain-containing protein [Dickeya]SLM62138.1 FIG00905966: hypothetical protein [Dickeya aquatica]
MKFLKVAGLMMSGVLIFSFGQSLIRAAHSAEQMGGKDYLSARRDSAKLAPDPVANSQTAIVQVYTAATYGWRGLVAVHPWIIIKKAGETQYQRYEVIGWGEGDVVRRNSTPVPDGYWFGSQPHVLVTHRGKAAEAMIPNIEQAVKSYPWPHTYHAWPGPNSNTFMAHIGREVPELKLDLPANAIGKDFRALTNPVGLSSSGKGVQVSVLGMLGLNLGIEEGIEVNVLGVNLGVDLNPPALRLPFIGRLGYD